MEKIKEITNIEHIKIIMNQKRRDVLQVLRTANKPMTAKQIADVLGVNPATISFHTNKLCDIGILNVASTKVIHGIVAKYLEPAAAQFIIITNESEPAAADYIKNNLAQEAESIFEKAKQNFLKNCMMTKAMLNKLSYNELYMTFDELKEFNLLINNFVNNHSQPVKSDQICFRLFVSCISDDDNLADKKSCC